MQEKKNKRRFILLVILTVIVLAVFWWIQPENRMDLEQDIFRVEDLSIINEVKLQSDTGSVTLSFNGSQWQVNEKYDADPNMIRVLFATLQQALPRRKVARIEEDSIYQQLAASGVEVSLYAGNELKEQFFAGGNAAKTQAFFADPSAREVYVMNIPGYRVYVSGIFELGESGWRDKLVFDFNWRNFKSLQVEFPSKPSESFTVSRSGNDFGISGIVALDTAKLHTFLDDLSLLTVEEYISAPDIKDSLFQVQPLMRLILTDVGNRAHRLELFPAEPPSRVMALIRGSQLAVLSREKIQGLLKPKSFFSKK
jgi:hypothetical protein